MIHVVSAMTEYQEYMNHVFSTKPIVLTTHFSQDYMTANIETSSLLRLAVTDPMIAPGTPSSLHIASSPYTTPLHCKEDKCICFECTK
jgi:hypothetical protein